MNEPVSPYVLSDTNCPAFWLIDNLWMTLAGSYLTNGNACFIEQVSGSSPSGLCTRAPPLMRASTFLRATQLSMLAAQHSRALREHLFQYRAWLNTAILSIHPTQKF